MDPKFAIVVPFYNEASRIQIEFLSQLLENPEIFFFFVNDGSTDETLQILQGLKWKYQNLSIINCPYNLGKSNAIRAGWIQAGSNNKFEFLGFMDSDGAVGLNDLLDLINNLNPGGRKADAAWKSRIGLSGRDIRRRMLRHYISRILATIFGAVDKDLPYDTQCGLKIFRVSGAFFASLETPFVTRWFLDLEMYIRLKKIVHPSKLLIWEVPCNSWSEISNSNITFRKSIKLIPEMWFIFYNLAKLRSMKFKEEAIQ